MFSLAEMWGLRADGSNPRKHIKKYAEEKRERFLSPAEINRVGGVLREMDSEGVELASAIAAAYEHVWNPRWRTSWYGGYVNIDYNGTATGIINSTLAAGSVCARPFAGLVGNFAAVTALAGNNCNPDYSFYQVGSRTQWNPVPRLDIGLDVTYTGINTAYKGPGVYAANGSRPAVGLFDDEGIWSAIFRWQRNFYS